MKKILSLITLVLAIVTGACAQYDPFTYQGAIGGLAAGADPTSGVHWGVVNYNAPFGSGARAVNFANLTDPTIDLGSGSTAFGVSDTGHALLQDSMGRFYTQNLADGGQNTLTGASVAALNPVTGTAVFYGTDGKFHSQTTDGILTTYGASPIGFAQGMWSVSSSNAFAITNNFDSGIREGSAFYQIDKGSLTRLIMTQVGVYGRKFAAGLGVDAYGNATIYGAVKNDFSNHYDLVNTGFSAYDAFSGIDGNGNMIIQESNTTSIFNLLDGSVTTFSNPSGWENGSYQNPIMSNGLCAVTGLGDNFEASIGTLHLTPVPGPETGTVFLFAFGMLAIFRRRG
jgi:hypothetical protein